MNPVWAMELAKDGARNLVRHKLRSTLALLGVVFGVGAVIAMLAIGEGAQQTVLREIQGLGLNNIILDSVQPPEVDRPQSSDARSRGMRVFQYGLTERDVDQIRALFPSSAVSVAQIIKQKVYGGSQRTDAKVLGVSPDYFGFFSWAVLDGVPLSAVHNRDGQPVAVVTESVAASLRKAGGVVGRTIHIGNEYFEVIGVVRMPSRLFPSTVFIPYNTADRLFGAMSVKREAGSIEFTRTVIGEVLLHLENEKDILPASKVVERVIRTNHASPDVTTVVPLDLLQSKQKTQRILNLVLIVIAAISLLVGGIGIMNIMLAVVTERIPEIGVRRALGACQQDILWQFLAETLVLSTVGGLLGCALGLASVPFASHWTGWPGIVTPSAVFVSLAVSWLVGVVFGLAPAVQASKLNPVECLRYGVMLGRLDARWHP